MIAIALILVYTVGRICAQNVDIECVPLPDCPEFFNLVHNQQSVSEKVLDIIRASHCGFDGHNPKVFCAVIRKSDNNECQTPKGEQGICTPVTDCKPFQRLLSSQSPSRRSSWNSILYLIQKYRCGETEHNMLKISVCCPKENMPHVINNKFDSTGVTTPPTKVTPVNRPVYLPRPSDGTCGKQLLNKVVGGKVTDIDEFPWTALLKYQSDSEESTACAGSLINERYVVTAAHCVDHSAMRSVGRLTHVILGEFDTRNETDCINQLGYESCADPPVTVPVEKVTIHPQWYRKPKGEINHDIALVRLAYRVKFTDFIQPICLPWPKLYIGKDEKLVVTGWGKTEEGTTSFVKLKTTLPMADRNYCVQKYKQDKKLVVGDGELCVGGEEGKDSCSGDSGGPLMLLKSGNGYAVWFLVGIVSFGSSQPCGLKDFPGLYTFVPKYVEWIYNNVRP